MGRGSKPASKARAARSSSSPKSEGQKFAICFLGKQFLIDADDQLRGDLEEIVGSLPGQSVNAILLGKLSRDDSGVPHEVVDEVTGAIANVLNQLAKVPQARSPDEYSLVNVVGTQISKDIFSDTTATLSNRIDDTSGARHDLSATRLTVGRGHGDTQREKRPRLPVSLPTREQAMPGMAGRELEDFQCSLQQVSPSDYAAVKRFVNAIDPESKRSTKDNPEFAKVAASFKSEALAFQEKFREIRGEVTQEFQDRVRELESSLTGLFTERLRMHSLDGLTVINKVQLVLDHLAGHEFGSLERNKEVASVLQSLLNRLGLRVLCPKEGCGQPAYIRCAAAGRTRSGAFRFEHRSNGRHIYHGASVVLPKLKVILAPPSLGAGRKPG